MVIYDDTWANRGTRSGRRATPVYCVVLVLAATETVPAPSLRVVKTRLGHSEYMSAWAGVSVSAQCSSESGCTASLDLPAWPDAPMTVDRDQMQSPRPRSKRSRNLCAWFCPWFALRCLDL
ncbi:hypothetical protein L226DRAFT_534212 [Lentinus tigrinus ALCF2SS1-7]|uniref:uncharacterized protein n=1 Tax=Lentinus tigrinus ALCF2SS1-7 TaxID=1328758 RepID=UPI0011661D9F|nr:hypothetical protein L226DRAFT_534212 [Lentinus tigrinus ALCF2SS1-7]